MLVLVVLLTVLDVCVPLYHHQFAVYVPGGAEKAHELAHKHGFVNHGEVSFEHYLHSYIFTYMHYH